ncbi:MAG: leucine-rich repeat protein [Alistipes sp.]|nr:leucine-rich repeat protein [Alistipes sp.]
MTGCKYNYCLTLEEITIPESVTSIGKYAFAECHNLRAVYCKPTTPPTLNGTENFFHENAAGRKIYVSNEEGVVDAYKSADKWSVYADDIEGYEF